MPFPDELLEPREEVRFESEAGLGNEPQPLDCAAEAHPVIVATRPVDAGRQNGDLLDTNCDDETGSLMGVWEHMWAATAEPVRMPLDRLAWLCADLLDERVTRPRWALVTGRLQSAAPISIGNQTGDVFREQARNELLGTTVETYREVMTFRAFGTGSREAAAALAALPADCGDVAVYFPGFDFGNPGMAEAYGDVSDPEVAVYSLAEPTTLRDERDNPDFMGPDGPNFDVDPVVMTEHSVRTVLATYAKNGPSRPHGPLRDVLLRHFGDDMLECCAFD
jgi:hypothetical protein